VSKTEQNLLTKFDGRLAAETVQDLQLLAIEIKWGINGFKWLFLLLYYIYLNIIDTFY